MFKPYDPPREPLFDVEILRRHITADWLKARINEAMAIHEAGEKTHFYDRPPTAAELGTDEALERALPHPANHKALQEKIADILCDLQAEGLLNPIPHGADRNVREAVEWNGLVAHGREGVSQYGWRDVMNTPMARAIGETIWSGGYDAIREAREAAGFDRNSADKPSDRVAGKALMECNNALIDKVVASCIAKMEGCATGVLRYFQIGGDAPWCPKTDARLNWVEGELLSPALGVWHHGGWNADKSKRTPSRFELIGPFDGPKPIRHVEFKSPSGTILIADWFRIPGFNEGVKDDAVLGPSINSALGVDNRTQDHYERLGLLRVHTTNSSPRVSRDGDLIRIGYFDEDSEDLWVDDPDAEYGQRFLAEKVPDEIGRVCCDLWDVTFADREILADILVAGGEAIAANGGIGDRGREVEGAPLTREEALALLDAYEKEHDVVRLEVEPGASLHLYMATGNRVSQFHEHFRSPDVSRHDWLEDMFILSPRALNVAAELVDAADWVWPERYCCSHNEEIEP
ncbi:hypothetical protein [Leisingera caerulea]|uniref:hypothetical protein n=1 Tax=Leisingera caerulea TaxID=506591 RepID=UPI0004160A8D|nr:hypothetical protein [Leisingera caerulea]